MLLGEISELTGAKLLTKEVDLHAQATSCCSCDLLSHVLAHGKEGMAWITIQAHMNVVAIAVLRQMPCVIVASGISVPQEVCEKAEEEGIAVFSSEKGAYELCGLLHAAGLAGE